MQCTNNVLQILSADDNEELEKIELGVYYQAVCSGVTNSLKVNSNGLCIAYMHVRV